MSNKSKCDNCEHSVVWEMESDCEQPYTLYSCRMCGQSYDYPVICTLDKKPTEEKNQCKKN